MLFSSLLVCEMVSLGANKVRSVLFGQPRVTEQCQSVRTEQVCMSTSAFTFPVGRTRRADNASRQRAIVLLNCLASEFQDADFIYDSISELLYKANLMYQICM